MTENKNRSPLILGALLVLVGLGLLALQMVDLEVQWSIVRFIIPALMLWLGVFRLIRHFSTDSRTLVERPSRAGLFSGLFWTFTGGVILLSMLDMIEGLDFFGSYWPGLLVIFGLGKIADYYRSEGQVQVRAGEVFGVVFLIVVGLSCGSLARAQWPLLHFPLITDETGSVVEIWSKKFSWQEDQVLALDGVEALEVSNLYGNIQIDASERDDIEIELQKVVYNSAETEARVIADRVSITSDRSEANLKLGTNRRDLGDDNRYFKSHLKLRVPRQLNVSVVNGHGHVYLTGLRKAVVIENQYGNVDVTETIGDVQVKNRYGRATVRNVSGAVTVNNDHGEIEVEDQTGDVNVRTSRAAVTVRRAKGTITIVNNFGGVHLEDIEGTVGIDGPGSEVSVSDVDQMVTIKNSHKNVTARALRAGLSLETSGNNRAVLDQIAGPVVIRSTHSDIQAQDLDSGIKVESKSSRITVQELEGDFDIATTIRPVRVIAFNGGGRVLTDYGDIELVSESQLEKGIIANTRDGKITLAVPEGSFRLSAQAPGGRVVSDFGEASNQERESLDVTVGRGGPEVRLQTSHAPIFIRKKGD